jgi:hypothetical protein
MFLFGPNHEGPIGAKIMPNLVPNRVKDLNVGNNV